MSRGINYLLVPLHTTVFTDASSYGIVSDFYAWAALINVIYLYGMETAFFRFASDKNNDEKKVFGQSLSMLLITTFLFSGSLLLFSQQIADALGYPNSSHYIVWFGLLFAVDAIAAIPFAKLRLENRPLVFAGIKLTNVVLNVGLNAFFFLLCPRVMSGELLPVLKPFVSLVYDPDLGLGYAFLSNLIANAFLLPMLWKQFAQFRPSWNKAILVPMLAYALPLVISGLSGAVNEVADRVLLLRWLPDGFYGSFNGQPIDSQAAVGIYSACYKLSIFITLAVQGFKYAAEPFFFSNAENENRQKLFAAVMNYFILTCCLMTLFVLANVNWIADLSLGEDVYLLGLAIVPILFAANIFLGIYYNLSVWFKLTNRTQWGGYIGIIGAVITILLNLLFIPVLGYFGSALATLACYASMALISYLIGQKYYPIPYQVGRGTIYLVVTFALAYGIFFIDMQSTMVELLARNGLALLALAVVFWMERHRLMRIIKPAKQAPSANS